MSSQNTSALVYFADEKKTDIIDSTCIPPESRFKGGVCQITWGGLKEPCTAKVLMISGNMEELDAAEDAFHAKIDEEKTAPANKRARTRNRRYDADAATDKDVSRALDERPKLTEQQKEKKKVLAKRGRAATAAQKSARTTRDKDILTFQPFSTVGAPKIIPTTSCATSSTSTAPPRSPVIIDTVKRTLFSSVKEVNIEEAAEQEDDPGAEQDQNADQDQNNNTPSKTTASKDSASCICNEIRNLANPGTKAVWWKVGELLGVRESSGSGNDSKHNLQYIEVKPAQTDEQVVELTKGSGVYISLLTKNQIKVDFSTNPSKMVGALLVALYGQEIFRVTYVTARGNAPGSKAIKTEVLQAMMSFINRNVPKEKKMSSAAFTRCVNRRALAWRDETREGLKASQLKKGFLCSLEAQSPKSAVKCTPVKKGWEVQEIHPEEKCNRTAETSHPASNVPEAQKKPGMQEEPQGKQVPQIEPIKESVNQPISDPPPIKTPPAQPSQSSQNLFQAHTTPPFPAQQFSSQYPPQPAYQYPQNSNQYPSQYFNQYPQHFNQYPPQLHPNPYPPLSSQQHSSQYQHQQTYSNFPYPHNSQPGFNLTSQNQSNSDPPKDYQDL